MLILILIGYLIYRNCRIAKDKGKNVFLWGVLTFVAIFFTEVIGMFLLVAFFYPEYLAVQNIEKSQELAAAISNNMLHSIFILFCGVGGYLLIRYILEQSKGNSVTGNT